MNQRFTIVPKALRYHFDKSCNWVIYCVYINTISQAMHYLIILMYQNPLHSFHDIPTIIQVISYQGTAMRKKLSFDNVSRWKQLKNVTVGLLMVWQNTRLWHLPTTYYIITTYNEEENEMKKRECSGELTFMLSNKLFSFSFTSSQKLNRERHPYLLYS